MNRELFFYWRVAAGDAQAARVAAKALQAGLCRDHPGLVSGLYQRADETDSTVTLMETYRLPGGITAPVQAALAAAGDEALRDLCQGRRHLEVFVPVTVTG